MVRYWLMYFLQCGEEKLHLWFMIVFLYFLLKVKVMVSK